MAPLVCLNFVSLQAHILARCPFVRREKGSERRSAAKVFTGEDEARKGEVTFRMTADRRICGECEREDSIDGFPACV